MAYPRRVIITGATYFVTSPCLNYEPFLQSIRMKDIVIACIRKTQHKYSFELSAYAIMDNHLRLVIRTIEPAATISKIMQHIKANITRLINRRIGRHGTIWNERFKSSVIDIFSDAGNFLRDVLGYAYYDPERCGITENKKYSSISAYMGEGPPPEGALL